jgi:hypothetical protein
MGETRMYGDNVKLTAISEFIERLSGYFVSECQITPSPTVMFG